MSIAAASTWEDGPYVVDSEGITTLPTAEVKRDPALGAGNWIGVGVCTAILALEVAAAVARYQSAKNED